ncbi:hypothetical protein Vadar_025921 [Vaccinium darrowii]|uniref:Uncharacterized protein n=1 Tax=Vaccinium darrowii TaxID=229202 RepID=A0ACB7XTA7_9ERIC|nr:hypothetical protein Vadar_025921 [Vaccinium darrowii]
MMQSPNHSTLFACRECDKVVVGAHEMIRHSQLAHMRGNEIIYEDLNPKPYSNHLDQVRNSLRRNLSHQNPIPSVTQSRFQSIQHYSSVEQNPSSITSQVPSSHGARISSHQVSPYTSRSFRELPLASVQSVPRPIPPPLVHIPISNGSNYQDQVFSHQNPSPSATHSGFQSIQRYSSVKQNPSSITSQVPSSRGARISSHQVFPYTPPSFRELLPASSQPLPKLTPPSLAHIPISNGCSFRSPPNLAPPLHPFVVRNHKFVKKPSVQEVEHIFEGGRSTHDCTKLLIDKLDIPIPDGIEGLRSIEENAGNRVNPKIDLTLKL